MNKEVSPRSLPPDGRAMRRVPITSQGLPRTVAAKPAVKPAEKCRPILSGMPIWSSQCLAVSYDTWIYTLLSIYQPEITSVCGFAKSLSHALQIVNFLLRESAYQLCCRYDTVADQIGDISSVKPLSHALFWKDSHVGLCCIAVSWSALLCTSKAQSANIDGYPKRNK